MSLEMTASRVCSSRRPTAQAFVAITTRSAVTTPSGVCRTAGARRSSCVTFVPSWMRTPSSSATRRSPRTSSAGWRIAADGSNMPAMWRSEPLRSAVCSGVHSSNGITPSSRQVAITPSQAPSWACDVAVQRWPPRWKCASMPCSLQNAPISSTASSAACASASAAVAAAQLDERAELGPPRDREAAVAAARAAAADVLLEHDDIARGLALLDADRGPEPGVAAAHDRDVGARGALERRGGGLAGRERLVEPERAMRHGAGDYGVVALGAPQHLGRGVGRALLGRLVEVDRDALPLVEVHRLGLVRERDAAHRALHVDARQHGNDGGGSDRAGRVDRPLPGVELIPGERLVDQRRVLVALRVQALERPRPSDVRRSVGAENVGQMTSTPCLPAAFQNSSST